MENKTYKPVIYANHELNIPELNWKTSISVDYFNFADTTPYKVFWQLEPEDITPTEAKLLKNFEFYDLILTYNNNVLSACHNAVFFLNNGVWTQEADTSQKKFAVSFLASSKTMTPGHQRRVNLFHRLSGYNLPSRSRCTCRRPTCLTSAACWCRFNTRSQFKILASTTTSPRFCSTAFDQDDSNLLGLRQYRAVL